MLSAIAFPAACAGAMALACEDAGEAAGGDCFAIALMLRPPSMMAGQRHIGQADGGPVRIRKFKHGKGTKNAQCIYWDRQLPGFGVRVFPSGRRMFVCSYRVQGRKRLATLGRGDVLRLDVARKKAVYT